MEKQWYAVYTRPRSEKKVAEILTRKKIENYFPLNRITKDWEGNKGITEEPLFTSYIFVRVNHKYLSQLRKIPGIVNLVYWLGKPVIIDESEISMIKGFINNHINIRAEKTVLGNGTLRRFDSSILEQDSSLTTIKNKKANIVLPSLGYILTADVEISSIRIISSDNLIRRSSKLMPLKLLNSVSTFNNFFRD
jgi:transcription antitermination factor NusG